VNSVTGVLNIKLLLCAVTVFSIENDFCFEFGLSVECGVQFSDLFSVRFGSVKKLARTVFRHNLHIHTRHNTVLVSKLTS